MGCREETNPPQASVLHMGFCYCWQPVLGFDSRSLCDISFLFFPKSTATHRNHMKYVCALFILVLVVQIVHAKKPQVSKQI